MPPSTTPSASPAGTVPGLLHFLFGAPPGAALRAAERWLLPGACITCGEHVGADDPLVCALCQSRWRRLPEPLCPRCGQPRGRDPDPCRFCASWPLALDGARSAVWLDGGARRAVHALKYEGWWRLAEVPAIPMARLGLVTNETVLVPIPLNRARARRRGYNQAEALARALAARTGATIAPDALARTRATPTQTALTPEARRANVAGAFAAGVVRGARVVLVDDVLTTGATLGEAAVTLAEAGAASVHAITFARAEPPIR